MCFHVNFQIATDAKTRVSCSFIAIATWRAAADGELDRRVDGFAAGNMGRKRSPAPCERILSKQLRGLGLHRREGDVCEVRVA